MFGPARDLVHMARRIYPMTQGVFRKIIRGTHYNGYQIPDGGLVQLNYAHSYCAESLYPEPVQ